MRPIKDLIEEVMLGRDNSDLEKAFGLTKEQAKELLPRLAQGMLVGAKLGAIAASAGWLMILGLWALYRFFVR